MEKEEAEIILRQKVPFYAIDARKLDCPLCEKPLSEEGMIAKCPRCDVAFEIRTVYPELRVTDPYRQLIPYWKTEE